MDECNKRIIKIVKEFHGKLDRLLGMYRFTSIKNMPHIVKEKKPDKL